MKVRSLTQLGTTLSVGVVDLEDLILNYNQGTSGERVIIGVKKRRIGEGVRTPLSLAPYPSAHHNSSPLLKVNVARRKTDERGPCCQEGGTTTEKKWLHGVPRRTKPEAAAKETAKTLPDMD